MNKIDINNAEPVNVTPMTLEEARECTEQIRMDLAKIETIRVRLLEMERRQGFLALGYSSWREWAISEYSNQSQGYLYRLLDAAKVEANLAANSTIVETVESDIPISHLAKLAKLPPSQQPVALRKASEMAAAENKPRTAKHVAEVVHQMLPPKPSKSQSITRKNTESDSGGQEVSVPVGINSVQTVASHGAHQQKRVFQSCWQVADSQVEKLDSMLADAVETCLEQFTIPKNLDEPLEGKVYIFLTPAQKQWANKLLQAYRAGEVKEAIAVLPLEHGTFVKFADYTLVPLPENLVAVYLGTRVDKFIFCFKELGAVWHRLQILSFREDILRIFAMRR